MLVCSKCKGKNIEHKVWADANTDVIFDDVSNGDEEEDQWCRDCEEHVFFDYVNEQ